MTRTWFKRLIPRPETPPAAVTSGEPTRVVDVDLYRDLDGGIPEPDWTAEWGLLDEQMVDEITSNNLSRLVEHVLSDARRRWGHHPDVTVQWVLHQGADRDNGTDVTGTVLDGVTLPITLYP